MLWDCARGRLACHLGSHSAPVRALAAADGNVFVAGSDDGHLRVWDQRVGGLAVASPGGDSVLSPGAHGVIARGVEGDGTVTGVSCAAVDNAHGSEPLWAASGGVDGQVVVWDARKSWAKRSTLDPVGVPTAAAAMSGGLLVTGTSHGVVRVWKPMEHCMVAELPCGGCVGSVCVFEPVGLPSGIPLK